MKVESFKDIQINLKVYHVTLEKETLEVDQDTYRGWYRGNTLSTISSLVEIMVRDSLQSDYEACQKMKRKGDKGDVEEPTEESLEN